VCVSGGGNVRGLQIAPQLRSWAAEYKTARREAVETRSVPNPQWHGCSRLLTPRRSLLFSPSPFLPRVRMFSALFRIIETRAFPTLSVPRVRVFPALFRITETHAPTPPGFKSRAARRKLESPLRLISVRRPSADHRLSSSLPMMSTLDVCVESRPITRS